MPSHTKSEGPDIGEIDSNEGAERCPTAAWDMQAFWYNVTKAGNVKYGPAVVGAFVQIERNGNGVVSESSA
jgi:hypothetical protein